MRLLELRLLAFGHFSDVSLDFEPGGALHLIYGANEAGKSTALRAIGGLLYGIPPNTGDAHVHRMEDLRIGARIAGARESLSVTRRKGRKNTLLDEAGEALDEAVLQRLLSGVDETTFGAMFGLDHDSLRRGAEALLQGKGGVGESLFDAGTGGRGIQTVLDEINAEADGLFLPRGKNQKINQTLRELKEARRRRSASELSATAWRAQVEGLAADREERDQLVAAGRGLAAEQSSLQRALRTLPQLARWRDLRGRREALGEVVLLAADARDIRQEAQRDLDECARLAARLREEIEKGEAGQASLNVPAALAALGDDVIESLTDGLGSYRKACEDLPRREGELGALRAEVERSQRGLGPDARKRTEEHRVPVPLQARIRKLANEKSGLLADLQHDRRLRTDLEARLEAERERLAGLGEEPDLRALQGAVSGAARVQDFPDRLTVLHGELRRRRAARDAAIARLMPWQGSLDELSRSVLPTLEMVEEYAARLDAADRRGTELDRANLDLERRQREIQRELSVLEGTGAVPREADLEAARTARDASWRSYRKAACEGFSVSDEMGDRFETAVRDADEVADRLRREADRVALGAALIANNAALQDESSALVRECQEVVAERMAIAEQWSALWRPLGLQARSAAETRAWLRRVEEAQQQAQRFDETESEIADLTARVDERRVALSRELTVLDEAGAGAGDIAELFETGRAVIEKWANTARRREDADRAVVALERDVSRAERSCEERATALREWEASWGESVEPLGLPAASTPEEAQAVLEQLTELYAQLDSLRKTEKRIAGIHGDAERYRAQVETLVERHLPEARGAATEEAAERLLRAYRQAVSDQREGERIAAELEERRLALEAVAERRAGAERRLAVLLDNASVHQASELEECERLSGEAMQLDRRIEEIGDEILLAGEGASIEDLVRQTEGLDVDVAQARLAEIKTELEEIDGRRETVMRNIIRCESGLETLEHERGAAAAAEEVQECLAGLAGHVHHYMRVRLAAAILDREVERYRRDNQGPVLAHANNLFPRLTLGRYKELRVGFDKKDEAVLRCVRTDGTEVDIDGLSEGTRDQLYLALRLATLQHYAAANEPMPLILDDVLIHFDDPRAAAALEVLSDFAATTQVLFFTHNKHLMELACQVVAADKLVEHDLGAIGPAGKPLAAKPTPPILTER